MSKVKVLVVEDELIIADNICDTLEDLGYEVTEPAINYTEAFAIIEEEKPDIAILDIQLSGRKTGIDIAKKINEDYNFPFIFLTSNADEYTIDEAKEVAPPAFLVKPFSKDDLFSAIEIALSNFNNSNSKFDDEKDDLFVKTKTGYTKLKIQDIVYVKSLHVYLEVVLKSREKFLIRKSMDQMLSFLNDSFMRTHRSYIVNFNYIESIESSKLKIHQFEIPIGKTYRDNILRRLKIL